MAVLSLIKYSALYALWLTLWSLSVFYGKKIIGEHIYGLLGFGVIFMIYFYLNWSLTKLSEETGGNKQVIILSGAIIATVGCCLSSATMGIHNYFLGIHNNILNTLRAVVVHALIALIVSFFVAQKLAARSN